jgi:peptidoglycan/LPS O-acetylase OafA/YrhL
MHVFHTPTGGFLGVDLFFVLSGYLITTLLLREWERDGRISLRGFYRRRALRLLPALFVVVAAYLTASIAVLIARNALTWQVFGPRFVGAVSGALYFSNILQAWHSLSPEAIRHLWSLAAEEQFYLLWPPALLVLLKARVSRKWISRILFAALALVVVHRLQLTIAGANQHRLYFAPDTTADAILIGCLAALWTAAGGVPAIIRTPRRRAILSITAWAVIAWMIVFTTGAIQRSLYEGELTVFAAAGALVVVLASADERGFVTRILSLRPMVYTGRISYGLYLWHPVVFVAVGLRPVYAVVLTFAAASASYRYVELPFLRKKRPVSPSLPIPAPMTATPVLMGAVSSESAAAMQPAET